ncbi:SurA N-terminal domain-containing protein [Gracilimonas sediminicola]|uniref:SurA N-terminal domain-containing protein n=1 Tax=Gracilimonas sediminicola TaxID=2952158 RepID=A0A9X2RF22_9BACT|nr:SurA N-terminal domain-containing protein [Gracilimonas sediminicola]MCP9291432.1 SurA N-terminal domain-containing protein [Gracilimonas sediminicola]
MRNSTGVILWVLIGSFGLLWVLSDVNFFEAMQAGPSSLGSVNGDKISNEEYQSRIQYYSNAYSQQTGNSMTPEMRAYYETQAWNELVNSRLLRQKMDDLGITVSDQEVLDMVYGENPAPVIRQNFTREDGTIDRAAVQQVLSSSEFSQQAVALEMQLREQRRQQKLNNYISAGLQVTEGEVEREFVKNNSTANVNYIRFPYSEVTEQQLEVSDAELREYYNKNRERYSRDESYRIQYVTFSKLPTASDTAQIVEDVRELITPFENSESDSLFLARQGSSNQYQNAFVSEDDIREEYTPVLDLEVGEVSDVILTSNQAAILKKTAEQGNEVKFQIMSYNIQALPSTIDEANEAAADFEFFASEESSFDEEAETRGLEVKEAFATKGNDFISGLGSSKQIMNFLETADEGDISNTLELSSDFVVLRVEEITPEGYRPFEEVKSQVETLVKVERRKELTVEKVENLLAQNQTLSALAESTDKEIRNEDNLRASATVLPGAGREPRVVGAIFALDEGETSGVIAGNSAAFVVELISKMEADLANLTPDQRQTIRQRLEQQKTQEFTSIWLEQLREAANIVDNRDRLLRQ